eukprot:TRINITY_DN17720_c0_g1_i2.p1 TRINITY_DN17720_c0_g1~~TRINITY_DN17720_c0_g1_i2.p1  ORF type:complete len:617 (+),score=108.66 TRINITY_DN17720_c0_g1_i2:71-1921(+)
MQTGQHDHSSAGKCPIAGASRSVHDHRFLASVGTWLRHQNAPSIAVLQLQKRDSVERKWESSSPSAFSLRPVRDHQKLASVGTWFVPQVSLRCGLTLAMGSVSGPPTPGVRRKAAACHEQADHAQARPQRLSFLRQTDTKFLPSVGTWLSTAVARPGLKDDQDCVSTRCGSDSPRSGVAHSDGEEAASTCKLQLVMDMRVDEVQTHSDVEPSEEPDEDSGAKIEEPVHASAASADTFGCHPPPQAGQEVKAEVPRSSLTASLQGAHLPSLNKALLDVCDSMVKEMHAQSEGQIPRTMALSGGIEKAYVAFTGQQRDMTVQWFLRALSSLRLPASIFFAAVQDIDRRFGRTVGEPSPERPEDPRATQLRIYAAAVMQIKMLGQVSTEQNIPQGRHAVSMLLGDEAMNEQNRLTTMKALTSAEMQLLGDLDWEPTRTTPPDFMELLGGSLVGSGAPRLCVHFADLLVHLALGRPSVYYSYPHALLVGSALFLGLYLTRSSPELHKQLRDHVALFLGKSVGDVSGAGEIFTQLSECARELWSLLADAVKCTPPVLASQGRQPCYWTFVLMKFSDPSFGSVGQVALQLAMDSQQKQGQSPQKTSCDKEALPCNILPLFGA